MLNHMTHYTSDIKLVVNGREFTHLRGVEYVWSVSICDGKLAFVGSGEVTVDESRLLDLTRMLMDASPNGQSVSDAVFCIRVTHRAPGQEHTDELLACRVVSSPYRCAGNLRKINIHFSMVRFDGHTAFAGMGYCIGSVVYLKSGSPPMTIVAIEKTVGGEEVLTQWFTPSGETAHGRFMVTSLTIHKPLDTKTEQANLSTSSHTWATIGIDGDVVRRIVREELSNATEGKIQAVGDGYNFRDNQIHQDRWGRGIVKLFYPRQLRVHDYVRAAGMPIMRVTEIKRTSAGRMATVTWWDGCEQQTKQMLASALEPLPEGEALPECPAPNFGDVRALVKLLCRSEAEDVRHAARELYEHFAETSLGHPCAASIPAYSQFHSEEPSAQWLNPQEASCNVASCYAYATALWHVLTKLRAVVAPRGLHLALQVIFLALRAASVIKCDEVYPWTKTERRAAEFFTFARPPTFSPRDIEVDGHVLHLPDAWTDDQVDAVRARLYAPPRAQSRLSVVPTDTVRSLVRDELSRLFTSVARES